MAGLAGFYGSLVIGASVVAAAILSPLIPELVVVRREERGLEARFGDRYRQYRRTTPCWLGKAIRRGTAGDGAR